MSDQKNKTGHSTFTFTLFKPKSKPDIDLKNINTKNTSKPVSQPQDKKGEE